MTTDASGISDPAAARTEWTPVKKAGNAFFTHELHQVSPQRIELRAAANTRIMFQAILIFGIVFLAAFILRLLLKGVSGLGGGVVGYPVFGVTLVAIGWGMIRLEMVPVFFDTQKGWYWKGQSGPQDAWTNAAPKNSLRLADVHALQILAKTWTGRSESHRVFTSYELNLVRQDGHRLNVIDHGNLAALQAQAQAIANLLQKPLWDVSESPINLDA